MTKDERGTGDQRLKMEDGGAGKTGITNDEGRKGKSSGGIGRREGGRGLR
jgi:hypothetical protein